MPLKLMYITNDKRIAVAAENGGVDWIFIDLETIGKTERQGHLDTVMSQHSVKDVRKVREALSRAQVLVRVNPLYEGSSKEINEVILSGADRIMLPYYKTKEEVEKFVDLVGGRAKTCVLCETASAVEILEDTLNVSGIDNIHIGLNDLHLEYKMTFMFELLANGMVDRLCKKIRPTGIPFGFGGIARIGKATLPAEYIVAEHYRLGSSQVILSRSFLNAEKVNDYETIEKTFNEEIAKIRHYEDFLNSQDKAFFENNRKTLQKKVAEIVSNINHRNGGQVG